MFYGSLSHTNNVKHFGSPAPSFPCSKGFQSLPCLPKVQRQQHKNHTVPVLVMGWPPHTLCRAQHRERRPPEVSDCFLIDPPLVSEGLEVSQQQRVPPGQAERLSSTNPSLACISLSPAPRREEDRTRSAGVTLSAVTMLSKQCFSLLTGTGLSCAIGEELERDLRRL